ncbi:MAG TPA: FtsQ-type POTRA domain-containing protein [Candidatus Angelobacter sp.]|nr:FtsQ-type POTRA domain-containing protein [Candidatus Angelobacter sp.]
MLAHNSVDRDVMARDSIELTQPEDLVASTRAKTRAQGRTQSSALNHPSEQDDRPRSRARGIRNEDDSELIINRDDLDLDELDGEEAQFLRANKRVPVRRSAIPKKTASQLKIAGIVAGALIVTAIAWQGAQAYGMHSWRFRINSSDALEITGVRNASLKQVTEVAGADIGKNIFYIPLEERQRQLEQIPWVESASVMRLLPNRISVTIHERTPVAFAQIGSRINLIDANGVVMGMPADRKTRYSFPVIRGINETEPLSSRAAAMKIYNRLVRDLGAEGATPNYIAQLSEVDLSDPEDVKVTANDAGGTLVVHLGATDFLAHYKLYQAHIAEWRQQFQNLQSVDLRYEGQVVVNPDKAQEGAPRKHADTVKNLVASASAKPAAKPVSHKTVAKKKVPQKTPQKTQRAQR